MNSETQKKSILILQRFNKKCNIIYKNLPTFTYEKKLVNYYDINSFIKSEKCNNDKNNKIREYIIGSIINDQIPNIYYNYSLRWHRMKENVYDYINMLLKNKNVIDVNNINCSHKGGRNNSYDFKITVNDSIDFNVELKFNVSNIMDSPQFVSPMKPSQYLSNSYEEYYYENYLTELSKLYHLELPNKTQYLNTIHSTEPKCVEKYIEKYYSGCEGSSRYTNNPSDINFYEDAKKYSKESIQNFIEMTELNINKLSEYLKNTQKYKVYMMYKDNKFWFEKINMDNYEIVNYIKKSKISSYIATTKTSDILNILIRWKNGNGIAFPAFQIKYTKIKTNAEIKIKTNAEIKINDKKIKTNGEIKINDKKIKMNDEIKINDKKIKMNNEIKINDKKIKMMRLK
jgi:hypothetical protein